jgi:hypothetical protein
MTAVNGVSERTSMPQSYRSLIRLFCSNASSNRLCHAESGGMDQGSTFIVDLPATDMPPAMPCGPVADEP